MKKNMCKKIFGSKLFRSCMVGIMVFCLVVIALPYPIYGEDFLSSQEMNVAVTETGLEFGNRMVHSLVVSGGSISTDNDSSLDDGMTEEQPKQPEVSIKPELPNEAKDWEIYLGDYSNTSEYSIINAEQWGWFAEAVNAGNNFSGKKVFLNPESDIVLSGYYKSVGFDEGKAFSGTFEGGGHTISLIGASSGLFGFNKGTISNITVTGDISAGLGSVGAIAERNYGEINGCSNKASITGDYAGGICGNNYGTIYGCSNGEDLNAGEIKGDTNAGGIVGSNFGKVLYCRNYGLVTAKNNYSAGIVAQNDGSVAECSNSGTIVQTESGSGGAGGITGSVSSNGAGGEVLNCSNSGSISGRYAGGITGYNQKEGLIRNCYNEGSVSDFENNQSGIVGYNGSMYARVEDCYTTGPYAVGFNNAFSEENVKDCFPVGVQGASPEFGDPDATEAICQRLRDNAKANGYEYTWGIFEGEVGMSTKVNVNVKSDGVTAKLSASSVEDLKMYAADKWFKGAPKTDVTLSVSQILKESVPAADQEMLDTYFNSNAYENYYKTYYEINLIKDGVKLNNVPTNLLISISVPTDSTNCKVLRVHQGEAIQILENQGNDKGEFTMATDRFSTYVLLTPKPVPDPTPSPTVTPSPTPVPTNPPVPTINPEPGQPETPPVDNNFTGGGSIGALPTPSRKPPVHTKSPGVSQDGTDLAGGGNLGEDSSHSNTTDRNLEEIGESLSDDYLEEIDDNLEEIEVDRIIPDRKENVTTWKSESVSNETEEVTQTENSVKTRRLDDIPRTGSNTVKQTAGLVGTVALGFYLYSRKIRFM